MNLQVGRFGSVALAFALAVVAVDLEAKPPIGLDGLGQLKQMIGSGSDGFAGK